MYCPAIVQVYLCFAKMPISEFIVSKITYYFEYNTQLCIICTLSFKSYHDAKIVKSMYNMHVKFQLRSLTFALHPRTYIFQVTQSWLLSTILLWIKNQWLTFLLEVIHFGQWYQQCMAIKCHSVIHHYLVSGEGNRKHSVSDVGPGVQLTRDACIRL